MNRLVRPSFFAVLLGLLIVPSMAFGMCLSPPGDVNDDDVTNVLDTQCFITAAIETFNNGDDAVLPDCLAFSPSAVDLSCDGSLDVTDVKLLVLLTLELSLPSSFDSDGDGCTDGCAFASSCAEVDGGTGMHLIDLDGDGPLEAMNVFCEMDVDGGGWTGINHMQAMALGATLTALDAAGTEGIDAANGPFTRDGSGGHAYHYDVPIPFGFDEFRLWDYVIKMNASSGNTTDVWKENFVMSSWSQLYANSGSATGDVGFGSADDSGPAMTLAPQLPDTYSCTSCEVAWGPGNDAIYTVGGTSNTFRIGWGETGGEAEGYYPWWQGMILLR